MKVPVPMLSGASSGAAAGIAVVLLLGIAIFAAKKSGLLPPPSPQR
jgi:hypothetical protein